MNSITGEVIAAKANLSSNEVAGPAKAVGNLIAEALRHAGLTQKEASFRMGYADASQLARLIAGEAVPTFLTRFFALPELQRGFLVALAEVCGVGVRVRTVVEIEQKAAV